MEISAVHTAATEKKEFRKFDVDKIRTDFPILKRLVNDKPLVYFDNAATTQKPNLVIDSMTNYYTYENEFYLIELVPNMFKKSNKELLEEWRYNISKLGIQIIDSSKPKIEGCTI